MSETASIQSGGLVSFTIKSEGNEIPDTDSVLSINVHKGVNQISSASIVIMDGDASTGEFNASSSDTFVPGNKITIETGYDGKNSVLFTGIVTQQSIRINRDVGSVLVVECKDEAVKMVVGRKSVTYAKQSDSDIMSRIIGNYSGLSADVSSTATEWPEQVQYYCTDWDYILSRAEANGMIVTALNGKVSVFPPDSDTNSVLTVEFGDNLLEFDGSMNALWQLGSVKANSWGFAEQTIISGEATSSYAGPGNLSSKKLSEVVGLSDYQLQTTAPLNSDELTEWSKATLLKSAYSKNQGHVTFQGSSRADPGKYLTMAKLGDRFNGDYFISNAHHTISEGNWITEVELGLSPEWVTSERDVMAPPASGLLPGVQGLYNATVKQMYEDPDSQYRVLVDVPMFDPKGEGLWARLANFYSTSGAGVFFMPEVGDEVVIGFLNEDPRFPVILGSMYSSTTHKPFPDLDPNAENTTKAIVTKSGINLRFDDENKVFTITTPNKNTAIFNDKEESITIKDQNDNSVVFSTDGITIKSATSLSIECNEKLTLSGNTGVTIKSSDGDVSISGMNIKQNADMTFEASGSSTASLEGGAQTTIKGAMVMIN
ncbi:MAG: type VI secretion system tip protein VgrG [Saprospiraceae bacterium]|nr:type VI secretion system tip protein VgrG [Saprospiraceae bacterium]